MKISNKQIKERMQLIEKELSSQPILLSHLMSMEFSEPEWLIDGLIPGNGLTCISGPPGNYKSWIMLAVSLAVSKGKKLFAQFDTKQTKVLIVDEENSLRLLRDRILKLSDDFSAPIYFHTHSEFCLENDERLNRELEFCITEGVKLIIFDSLVRIHSKEENSAKDMSWVFSRLKKFTQKDIVVMFTHHNRKTNPGQRISGADMRGSSDILAALDCQLAIVKNESGTELTVTQSKLRQDIEMNPFKLEVQDSQDRMSFVFAGENVSERRNKVEESMAVIRELLSENGQMYKQQLLDALKVEGIDIGRTTLNTALKRMENNGEVSTKKGKGNTTHFELIGDFAQELFENNP